jgi:hypothetical protein
MNKDFRGCEARTAADAGEALRRYGVTILRDAFDPNDVADLLSRADEHRRRLHRAAADGTAANLDLPSWYGFAPRSLACDVTALDPLTAGQRTDFDRTSLWRAMAATVGPVIAAAVGPGARWTRARGRVVVPELEHGRNGQLDLHVERTAFDHEGLHNIWLPLVGADEIANATTPGLQFYIGRLDFFRAFNEETKPQIYKYLETIGEQTLLPDPAGDDGGFFYRPEMQTGDVAIFSGVVPHASCIPPTATQSRVGCDIRIFPDNDANRRAMPQFAQAPLRVKLPAWPSPERQDCDAGA